MSFRLRSADCPDDDDYDSMPLLPRLRPTGSLALQGHVALSTCCVLLALAGWGAFFQVVLSEREAEGALQFEIRRLATERVHATAVQQNLRKELAEAEAELELKRRGIDGFIQALEQSRVELTSAREEAAALRQQLQAASSAASRGTAVHTRAGL